MANEENLDDRFSLMAETLMKESDRGCVIFGAAILHEELEQLFRAYFRTDETTSPDHIDSLFSVYAPLSTFSARIRLAFAMHLITADMKSWLEVLRRLRNDFAHESGPIDFDDPRCRDRLQILISKGQPRERSEEDDKPISFGSQQISRRKVVDRMALALSLAHMAGRIAFLTDQAREGKDMRRLIAKLEK